MNVLVLSGGTSSERDVSLRSAHAVIEALRTSSHHVVEYDTADGLDALDSIIKKFDVVFPVLHGEGGEDGSIQTKLEELSAVYIGVDSKTSQLCFNNQEFKNAVSEIGVRVPRGELVTRAQFVSSQLRQSPFVLKPDDGGSSIDTYICESLNQLPFVIEEVFERHDRMLLEELIVGTEITVPILASKALPVIEIIPPNSEAFDYENKYNGRTQELCPPKTVSLELQEEAQRLAEKIHIALGVRHISRTDMIITDDGELVVLELNTIPGMTSASLLPKSASVAGISMHELVSQLVELSTS